MACSNELVGSDIFFLKKNIKNELRAATSSSVQTASEKKIKKIKLNYSQQKTRRLSRHQTLCSFAIPIYIHIYRERERERERGSIYI